MTDLKRQVLIFLDQLWRRRWTALGFTWAVCLVGWLVVAMMPNRYVSEARFYVDTQSMLNPLLKGISVNADDRGREEEVELMQRTLTSRPNLMKVAQMTDLDKTTETEAELQGLIQSLEERITIRSQGANLFQVEFSDNSPSMARDVVQSLLTIFVESSVGDKREDIQTAKSFIESQIVEYEGQLKAAELRLADFKVNNMNFLSSSSESFAVRLEQARDNVKKMEAEYSDAVAQRDQLRAQLASTPRFLSYDAMPSMVVGTNAVAGTPQQRILALQAQLSELRLQYTEKHPDVVQTRQQLENLIAQQKKARSAGGDDASTFAKAQIPNTVHDQLALRLSDAEATVGSVNRKLQEAKTIVDDMQKRASDAPRIEAEFTNLNRDYQVLKSSYEGLLQRRESARIAEAADSTTEPVQFRVVAAPELPATAAGPNRPLFNTLVLVIGLIAGAGFVFLLMQVEDRVSAPDDLYTVGEIPVLGCVSAVATPRRREAEHEQLKKFFVATGALAAVFIVVVLLGPNFSAISQNFMAGMAS
ncbi:MAG: XrtA system polysaccharide chain length determinant [Rhodospirillaceae bacterium]